MDLFEHIKKNNDDAEIEQKSYKRYVYKIPPYDLLKTYAAADRSTEELQANGAILKEVVSHFINAQVSVTDIIIGPQVTRYELEVPMGASLKTILLRAADIAYELASVKGVRVEAPIHGRRAVAVEVPNANRSTVGLREVVSSSIFAEHKSPMLFSVGKDVTGELVVCDLEKTPHFLMAGQTSEVSAGLNSLIVSLLYKSSPDDLRFILIDPERTAFGKFGGMPHLLFDKIVTKPIEALKALEWAKKEMDRRYSLMQKYKCRKLSEYNGLPDVTSGKLSKLPHIVIVIDELANLMQSLLSRLIEEKIGNIAALARAAGIHLIVATQRPTTDVITGMIKVNLTSRIAYMVDNVMSSRIIIDDIGAEMLIGDGDMLFYPMDAFAPMRVQGSFVGEDEVLSVVDYLKENYECDFDEQAEKFVSGGNDDPNGIENDPILPQAIAFVIMTGQTSPTAIERAFTIGGAKAALIVDYMEEQGYISSYSGKRPRDILITREEFKKIFGKDVDEV